MAIWLLKTEPSVYSLADLEREKTTMWDGVSNALALQNLRLIQKGDLALIYHTGSEKAWVGVARVSRGYYLNPEKDDPKLAVIDVTFEKKLQKPVSLQAIKAHSKLASSDLVRLGRLSVVPFSQEEFEALRELGA